MYDCTFCKEWFLSPHLIAPFYYSPLLLFLRQTQRKFSDGAMDGNLCYHWGITLNGGPTGWRAVLPNEKHEFSVGWRAAQKGGPAGCTTGQASGLHIKLAYGKGRVGGLPFSAARPALFCNLPDGPPARPALQLVLSITGPTFRCYIQNY